MTTDSLRQEAHERAKQARISVELMEEALLKERAGRPYIVEFEDKTEGPAFRVTQEGPSRILYINLDHPFFIEFYAHEQTTAAERAAIELFCWTLGIGALEADTEELRLFYAREGNVWHRQWRVAFRELAKLDDDYDGRYGK